MTPVELSNNIKDLLSAGKEYRYNFSFDFDANDFKEEVVTGFAKDAESLQREVENMYLTNAKVTDTSFISSLNGIVRCVAPIDEKADCYARVLDGTYSDVREVRRKLADTVYNFFIDRIKNDSNVTLKSISKLSITYSPNSGSSDEDQRKEFEAYESAFFSCLDFAAPVFTADEEASKRIYLPYIAYADSIHNSQEKPKISVLYFAGNREQELNHEARSILIMWNAYKSYMPNILKRKGVIDE